MMMMPTLLLWHLKLSYIFLTLAALLTWSLARLIQQPNCIKVPKEICINVKANPKKVTLPKRNQIIKFTPSLMFRWRSQWWRNGATSPQTWRAPPPGSLSASSSPTRLIMTPPHLEIFWSFANAEINRSWLQKRLSPCTKPASEAESLVPTHVKLSKWCQSDYARANRYYWWYCKRESPNNLLLQITNLSSAAKMLKKTTAPTKNLHFLTLQPLRYRPQMYFSPAMWKALLKELQANLW